MAHSPSPRPTRGPTHAGVISLLRSEPGWLLDVLVERGWLPAELHAEVLMSESWPRGEEGRARETRADLVIRLWPCAVPLRASLARVRRQARALLLVELQNRIDLDKLLRWPELAILQRPYAGGEVLVVLLTFDPGVAAWIASEALPMLERILGPRHALLLTPELIPKFDPVDPREYPHRALLDAMLGVRDADTVTERLTRAILALREFERDEAHLYEEMLLGHFGEETIMTAIRELQSAGQIDEDELELTTFELQSFLYTRGHRAGREQGLEQGREQGLEQGLEHGLEQGRCEGYVAALLELLQLRSLEVDAELRARISTCHDPERARRWLARALVVSHARELLDIE